jgi:solute carrier family 38 (sodium-coupled neutral amino acid transporter), member 11
MPEDDDLPNGILNLSSDLTEEQHSLLRSSPEAPESSPHDSVEDLSLAQDPHRPHPKRQSSLSQPRPDGTPRTTNRVRFDVEDGGNGVLPEEEWIDEEDYLHSPNQASRPLLTDITPPSSSPFLSESFQAEDHLPDARPKSGMASAIMNMANSIIGAGEYILPDREVVLINQVSSANHTPSNKRA